MTKTWEIATYSGGKEILKETGQMGSFIFGLTEYPGLGWNAHKYRNLVTLAPEMFAELQTTRANLLSYGAPENSPAVASIDALIARVEGR